MAPFVLGGMMMIVLAQIAYLAMVDVRPVYVTRVPEYRQTPRTNTPESTSVTRQQVASTLPPANAKQDANANANANQDSAYTLVDDDRLLFAPPPSTSTRFAATSRQWLPPGSSAIFFIRPQTWAETDTGKTILSALSPDTDATIETVRQISGTQWDDVLAMTVGLYPDGIGYKTVAIMHVKNDPKFDAPADAWNASPTTLPGDIKAYETAGADADRLYYPLPTGSTADPAEATDPADSPETTDLTGTTRRQQTYSFLVGDRLLVQSAAIAGNVAAPLPPPVERLWSQIAADSDLVLVGQPNFFFSDGSSLLSESFGSWQSELRQYFVPDIASISVTLKLQPEALFWQTQMLPAGVSTEPALLSATRQRIEGLEQRMTDAISRLDVSANWQPLANAYPKMIRYVSEQVRSGISAGAVTFNQYLPASAVAQLSVASLLVANAPAISIATEVAGTIPQTVEEFLARPLSVSFDQESLKVSLETIRQQYVSGLPEDAVVPAFEIIGSDLQKNGITQNMQIRDFEQSNAPLSNILTEICLIANPDQSASGPTDPKQTLVWVVEQSPAAADNSSEANPNSANDLATARILLTTRDAASSRYSLPKVFVPTTDNAITD